MDRYQYRETAKRTANDNGVPINVVECVDTETGLVVASAEDADKSVARAACDKSAREGLEQAKSAAIAAKAEQAALIAEGRAARAAKADNVDTPPI
jgi:hypothetical protein